jgi:hypothetical protein
MKSIYVLNLININKTENDEYIIIFMKISPIQCFFSTVENKYFMMRIVFFEGEFLFCYFSGDFSGRHWCEFRVLSISIKFVVDVSGFESVD